MAGLDNIQRTLVPRLAAAVLALSAAGGAFITCHEGKVNRVYLDPVGIPTVCVGHTRTVSRDMVGRGFSDAVCADLLSQDTKVAEKAIKRAVKAPITQGQYDALTSFVFNVGGANFESSTLLRKANSEDCLGAGKEFERWVYARGQRLPGLVKRRAAERALWEAGCPA